MKLMIAKSNGNSLLSHSSDVSATSLDILKLYKPSIYNKHNEVVRIAGLLHDIGKCTKSFQDKLAGKKAKNEKYIHNIIGWAFITHHFDVPKKLSNIMPTAAKDIANMVFWHHGVNNDISKLTSFDVLKTISATDIQTMKDYVISCLGTGYLKAVNSNNIEKAPRYYIDGNIGDFKTHNTTNLIYRTCLISADRLVSSGERDVNKVLCKNNNINVENIDLSSYDISRINKQLNIIDDINSNTTIIKAPAGFGKTILGLLWNFKTSDKKLVWVCPRNIIAHSVYDSVISELKQMGVYDKISVELNLTGDIVHQNTSLPSFESDIIITNIDTYLKPSVNNSESDKLFFVTNCDVVFDEFHEFITDEALFACFVNIMYVRNNYTDSKTLMLSATPGIMNYLWENNTNKTQILPDANTHYDAVHNKKYRIVVEKISKIEDISNYITPNSSTLAIVNSISNSQKLKYHLSVNKLIHSQFEPDEKKNHFTDLLAMYGKKSKRLLDKENVVSTHILQASLDVSFRNMIESCMSPDSSMQRYGRCDRFGDYLEQSIFTVLNINDVSENTTVETLYNRELRDLWFDMLLPYNGTELTLAELYNLYNLFYSKYKVKARGYLDNKMIGSITNLSYIYPKKFINSDNSDITFSNGNKLRTSSSKKTCFIVMEIYPIGSGIYTNPMSYKLKPKKGFDEFDSDTNQREWILNNFIRNTNDPRFDYSELVKKHKNKSTKNIPISKIREHSHVSNTPYMVDTLVYVPGYGPMGIGELIKYNL